VKTNTLSATPLPQLAELRPRLDTRTSPLTVLLFAALLILGLAFTVNSLVGDIHDAGPGLIEGGKGPICRSCCSASRC